MRPWRELKLELLACWWLLPKLLGKVHAMRGTRGMVPVSLNAVSCSRSPQPTSAGFWEPGLTHTGDSLGSLPMAAAQPCGSSASGVLSWAVCWGPLGYHLLPRLLTGAPASLAAQRSQQPPNLDTSSILPRVPRAVSLLGCISPSADATKVQ